MTKPEWDAKETEKRRALKTRAVIRRIAELKIKALGLPDTVDEYIAKCQERTKR